MTMQEKIEVGAFAAILIIGLPSLLVAARLIGS